MKTTFTAIDPNGTAHTRTSETRIYTHTVVGLPSLQRAILYTISKENRKSFVDSYPHFAAYLDGTSRWLKKHDWETDAKYDGRVAYEIARSEKELNGATCADEYGQMKIDAKLANLRKLEAEGYYNKYQNMGWCGRADLAAKLAAKKTSLICITVLEVK